MDISKTAMAKRMKISDRASRIEVYKKTLAAEDYKIVKCAELRLINPDMPLDEMPYDVVELVAKRDRIRAKINEYEEEIAKLKAELKPEASEAEETEQTDVSAQ